MANFQNNPINIQFRKVFKHLDDNDIIRGKSDLAKNMGTYNHVVNSILKGQRNITVDQLSKLISYYRVNPRYIFEGKGPIILGDTEGAKEEIANYKMQVSHDLDVNENTIFLAHASEDKQIVRELYSDLKHYGLHPWLDEEDLEPGVKWDSKIREAIENSRFFIACITSNSTKKNGYIQKELRVALTELEKKSPENIYFIPVLFEDVEIPDISVSTINLRDYHAVKIYQKGQRKKLFDFLMKQSKSKKQFKKEPNLGIVKEFLIEGNTEDSLKLLIEIVSGNSRSLGKYYNNVVMLASRFHILRKDYLMGVLSNEEYSLRVNKVNIAILEIIDLMNNK